MLNNMKTTTTTNQSKFKRDRERQRQRETETERQRETETETDRQTDKERERERERNPDSCRSRRVPSNRQQYQPNNSLLFHVFKQKGAHERCVVKFFCAKHCTVREN